ncbi:hypothetical protein HDU81_007537 [Chytriomyces hyalinus]|nr:hypothetical protein HDU81_007537 [Chytriomyces hyalinus]
MLSAFEADYRIHAYSYTASSFNSFSSPDLDKFVNTTCSAVEQLYASHCQSSIQSTDTSAPVAAIADTPHFNLLEKIQHCKPIHIPQSVLDTLASFSSPANLAVNENSSNPDTASVRVPDVSSIGDYSSLLEEATRVFPDWSTDRICIISPSELHKHLSDVKVVQQEIFSDSSAPERQTRHIGLFATKSIPTNALVAEITGTLTTPAQLNTLSRPSKVSQQWIYETRFQSQRHPLFDAPLHHQSNQQSGHSLLESPGYATRTNLVECVPTNPSSDPFEISQSARVNPPFVFPHPARKLRFMDAALLVDSREDGCESPGRYARGYCAGDDAQRINSCNGVLRSVLVSASSSSAAEPETMDQLVLCSKESRLRLCIFTTRDVAPGEEIVLWRGDPASVQYPCICDVDAEECLVDMGVAAFEAAGLKVLEEERKKQVEEEERMDVGGMSPAVLESDVALVTKEAAKNVDEVETSNSQGEVNGGMPDNVDAMDVDTDVPAPIVEASSPAKDVPKQGLSTVSIFKDPDAAAKIFLPSATPGGKKAWLKAHFEEARKTSEAEAAVKRAKKEDNAVGASEQANMEIDLPVPPVSGDIEPITATEPPLKTKLTLKDFMNKRMQSSTSLGAGIADGVAADPSAPSATPVPADLEEQSAMQLPMPPIVNTATLTTDSVKPDVKVTNTSAPSKSEPVKPDVNNTQSTVYSQVSAQPTKPMEPLQSSAPAAQPPQSDPIRRPSQPVQSNPSSRPTFHADNAHSSHAQSLREHQQQQATSHNVSQQSQHATQASLQSFRERPVTVSNPNPRRTSGMDRGDALDFNQQQPQHRGSMDYSSSPVGGRFSPPSLPMNDGQRAGTGFSGREASSMPKPTPTNLGGGGGGGVPMSSGGSGSGGRITPPHADSSLLSTSAEYRFRDRDVGFSGRSAYLSSGGSLLSAGSRIRGIGLDGSAPPSSAAAAATSATGGASGAPANSSGGAFSMLRNRSFSGDASNPGGAGFPRERERIDAGITGSGGIAGRLAGEREGGRSSLLGSGGAASSLGDRFKNDEVAGVGGDFSMRDRGMEHRVGAGRGSEKLARDGYASSREAREYGGYNEFDSRYSAGAGGAGSSYAPSESASSRGVGGFGGGGSLLKGSDGAGRGQPFLSLRPKSPPTGYYPPMDRNEEALRNYGNCVTCFSAPLLCMFTSVLQIRLEITIGIDIEAVVRPMTCPFAILAPPPTEAHEVLWIVLIE